MTICSSENLLLFIGPPRPDVRAIIPEDSQFRHFRWLSFRGAGQIAIETFSSARSQPYQDIHKKLAEAYAITIEDAKETFRVDRLWKLRNGLVHNGKLVPIMSPIPDYMQALFVDLLRQTLALPPRRMAIGLVQDSNQKLHARIDEAVYMVDR